jgi:hypothetical protein
VVNRTGGKWQAIFLRSITGTAKPPHQVQLAAPKSGWQELWKQLSGAGFLTLPDFSELEDMIEVFDGTSYVIEVKSDGKYQTYAYLNPDYQKWEEAKQMLKIAKILYSEFNAF